MSSAQRSNRVSMDKYLRILGIILALMGLLVAGYMSWAEVTGNQTSCPGHTGDVTGEAGAIAVDCSFVQNSVYAKVFGIPVALLGVAGYLAILLVWLLEKRISLLGEYGHLLAFGMALFGVLFTGYLTYAELYLLYTVCSWCLTSALFITLVFIVSIVRMVQSLR